MNKPDTLKEDAGLTVEELMEIEIHVTQINIESEALLTILRKKRMNHMNKNMKSDQKTKTFFETIVPEKK